MTEVGFDVEQGRLNQGGQETLGSMLTEFEKLIVSGADAYARGEYAVELEIWKKAAVQEPDNAYWQANLAQAFANVGKFEQAEILFQYAMALPRPPSSAFNNYVVMLGNLGVPVSKLLSLLIWAVETSETYEHFQRHLANVSAALALADTPTDEAAWTNVRASARDFLERHNDGTPEHDDFVQRCVAAYANYQPFKVALAEQDWTAAARTLLLLEQKFSGFEFEKLELARIRGFRPLLEVARDFLALLNRVGSSDELFPSELREQLVNLHSRLVAAARNAGSYGSRTFLDILGWSVAELLRQCRWFSEPGSDYNADAHATPSSELASLSQTFYVELGEMLQATLLSSNRTIRRASQRLSLVRTELEREEIASKAWQSFRLTAHAIAGEYRGMSIHLSREMLGWNVAPRDRLLRDVDRFKSFIESRAHEDLYVQGKPQEQIARAILLAFLQERGCAEVPLRGGRVDVLVVMRDGVSVVEVKIWRGPQSYLDGISELKEYVARRAIPNLSSSLYLVLDPTASKKASQYVESERNAKGIDVVVVDIRPPAPSKVGVNARKKLKKSAL